MSVVRLAVLGCGYWGQNLLRSFWETEGGRLTALCDLNEQLVARSIRRYPTVEVKRSFDELINDPNVDAIALATPASTHFGLAKRALANGKHVLVEKPMAQTSEEVLELIELADRKSRTLMVDHTFLYTGAVRRMKQLVDSGDLGDMLYYDSVRVNLGLVQSDTNVLWDLAPHDLSIMDYLFDEEPLTVSAIGVRHMGCLHEDIAYVTLRFPDNLIAHFHVNWLSPVKIRKTLVGGSKKMIVYDDMEPTEKIKLYDRGVSISLDPEDRTRMLTGYRNGDMLAPQLDMSEALKLMAREFVSSIEQKRSPLSDGASGYRVVRILQAAQRSIEQNGAEIELPKSQLRLKSEEAAKAVAARA